MKLSIARHPGHRMLVLIGGALLIGLIAQLAATSGGNGLCDFQTQFCAYAYPW